MSNDSIVGRNCRIEVLPVYGDENVILNVYWHTKPAGEYEQIILPQNKAKALALILGDV